MLHWIFTTIIIYVSGFKFAWIPIYICFLQKILILKWGVVLLNIDYINMQTEDENSTKE